MCAAVKINYDDIQEKLNDLPTLPTVVQELNRIIADPMSTIADVEEVMKQDQSLTAKVLTLANSAYYAIPGGVSSLSRAIGFLGFDTVHQLVLAASVFSTLQVKPQDNFNMSEFWKHSIGVAITSEVIAEKVNHKNPSDLFTSGLIHDMGKVALVMLASENVGEISKYANDNKISFYDSEKKLELIPHTKIGQLLAAKWKLPVAIQNCILYHHEKNQDYRHGTSAEMNQNIDIIFLANLLVHALKFGNSGYEKIQGAPKDIMQRLGISPADIPKLVKDFKDPLSEAEAFLRILGS